MRPCCAGLRTRRDIEEGFPRAARIALAVRRLGRGHDTPPVLVHGGCEVSRSLLARALSDEALSAGCALVTQEAPVDCSGSDGDWRERMLAAAEAARATPVTRASGGTTFHERRAAVVLNVDAVPCGTTPASYRGRGAVSPGAFVKSCVESTPGCWWILTAARQGGVSQGLLSMCVSVTAAWSPPPGKPPGRTKVSPEARRLRDASRDLVARGAEAGAEGLDALLSGVRLAVDTAFSRGLSDSDVLHAALEGMTAAAPDDGHRRAIADSLASCSAEAARCRRAVWKACLLEQGLLRAFVSCHDRRFYLPSERAAESPLSLDELSLQ